MDPTFAGLPLAILLSLLLGSGAGLPVALPPGPPDPYLDQVAPPNCLYYTCWSPTAAPAAESSHPVERFFAEPDVQRMLHSLGAPVAFEGLRSNPRQSRVLESKLWPLAGRLLRSRPLALYVTRFDVENDVYLEGAAVVHLGPYVKEVTEWLDKLSPGAQKIQLQGTTFYRLQVSDGSQKPVEATLGVRGPRLIMGLGPGSVEQLLEREGGEPPQWLRELRGRFEIPRVATVSYINLQTLIRRTELEAILVPQLGLANLRRYVAVTGLDDTGYVCRAALDTQRPLEWMLGVLENEPLTPADLSPIPRTASVAVAGKLNLSRLLESVREAAGAERVDGAVSAVEQLIGTQLRQGFLNSLGDVWTVHCAPEDGGWFAGWTVTIPVRNRGKVQLALALDRVRKAAATNAQVKVLEYSGENIYYFSRGAGWFASSPAYCVTETHLVASLNPTAIRSWLQRRDDPKLSEAPEVARFFQPPHPPIAVAYANQKRLIEDLGPLLRLFLPEVARQMAREGFPFDPQTLPTQTTLIKHAGLSATAVRLTPSGLDYEQRQALPGGAAAALGPVTLAVMLPWIVEFESKSR